MASSAKSIRTVLGARARQLRQQLALTQEQVGEASGLHSTYVGGIERGERNVSLEGLEKLASALHVTLSELFDFPKRGDEEQDAVRVALGARLAALDGRSLRFIGHVLDGLEELGAESPRSMP